MTEAGLLLLKIHEGKRLRAYKCPAGVWTCGYGHTAGVKEGDVWTEERAEKMLRMDVVTAELDARALVPNFDEHSPRRQDALVNLAFNLGKTKLRKFGNFLSYFRQKHYPAAAVSLEHSAWYSQVKNRARDIVNAIIEG